MTAVLVALKGMVEGCKENTLASLVCQRRAGSQWAKRQEGRQTPGLSVANVDLDTDGSLLHSPSHLFSPFVSLLFPYSPLSLSFISFCPSFSLCLSPCHPSEAGGLARGRHSQAELGWEIAFTVHAKLHTKSNDWCTWKCLLQGKASCIVFACRREYSWLLAVCMSEKNLAMRPGRVSAPAIVLINHF